MKNNITGIIINDCADQLAALRQRTYFSRLFGVRPAFAGVHGQAPDLEAAGYVIDALDAINNFPISSGNVSKAILIVNVAPRGGKTKALGDNGTPFCYFSIGNALVVSTLAGECLSLVKQLGIVQKVQAVEVPTVTAAAVEWGDLTSEQAERINNSQFRSLEFLPLLAYWLHSGKNVPHKTVGLPASSETVNRVWHIDNFGNAKTTLLSREIGFEQGKEIALSDGKTAQCYTRLTDVPKDGSAVIVGSSGYGKHRFLEVVVQWRDGGFSNSDSATSRHGLKSGSPALRPDLLQLK